MNAIAEKLPPMALESEMCVIGALLLADNRADLFTETRAPLRPDSFVQADHSILFEVICDMRASGRKVDGTLLIAELEHRHLLKDVGGHEYVAQILANTPSAEHGPDYARKVADAAGWRDIMSLCRRFQERAFRPYKFEASVQAARELAECATAIAVSDSIDSTISIGDAAAMVTARRDQPETRRVPTGISSLDKIIGGLPKGKFTVIAADPRVGKSQLIKQIGKNIAERGIRFGLVSVEEDREKIAENILANESGVDNNKIAFGTLGDDEWVEVEGAARRLKRVPFFIEDTVEEIGEICIAIQRLVLKHKCEVIAVDHLHIISAHGETREQEISRITRALKLEFKRLNVPGIAAAQLNRGAQITEKPVLKNLRGSGDIEANADVVILLWREDLAKQYDRSHTPNFLLTGIVAKNKDGTMREFDMNISGATQRVGDMEDPLSSSNSNVPYVDPDDLP